MSLLTRYPHGVLTEQEGGVPNDAIGYDNARHVCRKHRKVEAICMDSVQDLTEEERLKESLSDWWLERVHQELDAVVPKAVEYGGGAATDLVEIGRTMGLLMGRDRLSDEEATEVGIHFYVVGKMARWTAAIKEGRRVSDDTLHDIAVYVKMMQRTRDVGGWPFAPNGKDAE